MDRVRVIPKSWFFLILSILLPGLAHFWVKRWDKAIFLITSFIAHVVVANFILHMVIIEQPLTILYLMYVIPYHYFYSIYDSLHCSKYQEQYKVNILLTASLIHLSLAAIFISKWQFVYPIKVGIIKLYPLLLLIVLVTYLSLSLTKNLQRYRYYARISSTILLSLLALTIMLDQLESIQWKYWLYAILVVICVELLVMFVIKEARHVELRLKLDVWGIFVSTVLITSSYLVVQYSDYPTKLLESFHAPTIEQNMLDDEYGIRYELPETKIPIDRIEKLNLDHLNGAVHIVKGNVNELTISPVLFVNTEDKTLADQVRTSSYVDVSFHKGLTIKTHLPLHSMNHYPRMNLRIVIPEHYIYIPEVNLKVDFGLLSVSDLVVASSFVLESNEAVIQVQKVTGPLTIKSKRGHVYTNKVLGSIDVETKKGDITLLQVSRAVHAVSLNGDIYVSMKHLNGDVNVTATVGSAVIQRPRNHVDYRLLAEVSFGKITDLRNDSLSSRRNKQLNITNKYAKYGISIYASDYILIR